MKDIFGVPMNAIMITLLILLAVCVVTVAWVALRRPVIFKLGMRNMPRRRHQSAIVVSGLMLSTLIIAAALGTGDTMDHSVTGNVYENLGAVDELVVASKDKVANVDLASEGAFPVANFDAVEAAVAGDAQIDGLMPQLDARAAVINETRQLAEPDIILSGVDPARIEAFGGLTTPDGKTIDLAGLPSDGVVLSEALASDLGAVTGDTLTIFYDDAPTTWTVAAIAKDSYLSGTRRGYSSGFETSGLAMPLSALQDLTGQPGMLSAIAISNAGGVYGGVNATDDVVATLDTALSSQGLGVDPIKQDRVDAAEKFSTIFTGLFLVLGLFSIAAGVLLIVLIFTMLAAERRSEMGMERALGTHRRQLIQQFVSEGSGYALLAGVIGSALGVGAAYGIATVMSMFFGDYVPIEPKVTIRSIVVAYCAGVVITFFTVVLASWKISRVNIVAAVRDIPDVSVHHRNRQTLVWGVLLLVAGGLLTFMGVSNMQAFFFMSGMSLLPFGIALILGFLGAPARPVYSAIGVALLVFWLLPDNVFKAIFGDYSSGVELFFVSGIVLVIATTLLLVTNLDLLLMGLSHLSGVFRSTLPAMRTAIAYPSATRGRTGMTIAMFSLIVFSLVMMATMNTNYSAAASGDEANAGWHVRADQIGPKPIADFTGTLTSKGVDTSQFEAVGVTHKPTLADPQARVSGNDPAWKRYPVYGMEASFIDNSTLMFDQRAKGYETDEAIVNALRTQPNVVVADAFAVPQDGNLGVADDAFSLTGLKSDDKVFDPITVDLLSPSDGSTHQVTVIGILDSRIGSLLGLYAAQPTIDTVYNQTATTSYFVALRNPDQAAGVARNIEAALLSNGVQGNSIRDELKEQQSLENGFLYIIEGFMGLGLLVGIAAVGVIAFRSVVERRQQIGVMRALGFQRRTVALSFMIETTFLVGLGGFAGTVLGLLLSRNLLTSSDSGLTDTTFIVPWTILIVIVVLTNVAALAMTWVPAIQAGRIAPAEALRYE
ncbi:MAG TPA: FtsX-like permease family protein [Thermomicrobiales bacterium]|nr:FtsX-like permease family protein [Thermomicrobiales bacterium]